MNPPVQVHIPDGHRSLGPSSLKKKTASTQSLSSKTLAQPISLPPLPTSATTTTIRAAAASSLPWPTTSPKTARKSTTVSSTNLPTSNANVVVVVSTAKPAKPQKVIFKNKAGPPPPKLVMTVKPSVVSTGAAPVTAVVAPLQAEPASISDSKSQTSISNNNNSIRLHSISNHKIVDEQQTQQQQYSSSKELSSLKSKLSERASSMFSFKGNQENSIISTGSVLATSEEQLTTTTTSENIKARKIPPWSVGRWKETYIGR